MEVERRNFTVLALFRECLARADEAAKNANRFDEIRYSFAAVSYLFWDLIFLPIEIGNWFIKELKGK